MRTLALGIVALGIWCGATAAAEPATAPATREADGKPKVSAVGLIVLRELDPTAMRALLDSPGAEYKTGVMLLGRVALPAANIVSVDKKLRVDKFSDDQGADLGDGSVKTRFSSDEGTQCNLLPDRKQCSFWLGSTKLPAPGAEKLLVEGSLNLQVGVGEKIGESQKLPLKLGQEFEAGDRKLKVEEISSEGREGMFYVTLSSPGPLALIKSIECTDGEGKAVAVQMENRYGRRDQGAIVIALARPARELTLRVVQFEKIESVRVPVKLEVKVGL